MNVENWGWNRRNRESLIRYYKRLSSATNYCKSKDTAFSDLNPTGNMRLNDKLGTDPNIFYFSFTTGM